MSGSFHNESPLTAILRQLSVRNYGLYTQYGAVQQNNQTTNGIDASTGRTFYKTVYKYPLYALSTYFVKPDGFFTLDGEITYGKELDIIGNSVFPTGLEPSANYSGAAPLVPGFSGTSLSTTLTGTGHYQSGPGGSTGFGSTAQKLTFKGLSSAGGITDTELYYRDVAAVNLTILRDVEKLIGKETMDFNFLGVVPNIQSVLGKTSPKEAVGRGPGAPKAQLVQVGN